MPHRRPFRVIPSVEHTRQMGWAYLRWARGTWRVPALDRGAPRRRPTEVRLTWPEFAVMCVAAWVLVIAGAMQIVRQVVEIWP